MAELYPVARLRPQPKLSLLAKLLLTIGMVASSALFIGGMVWSIIRRELWAEEHPHVSVRPGGGLVGIVMLIPAMIPGLILGWIAYRLPKLLALKCSNCSWRERYKMTRTGAIPAGITPTPLSDRPRETSDINRTFAQINSAPPLPPAPTESGYDTNADVSAWIYAEIAGGKSPEEVSEQLIQAGWETDIAEHLAEIGRRQTRHLRR